MIHLPLVLKGVRVHSFCIIENHVILKGPATTRMIVILLYILNNTKSLAYLVASLNASVAQAAKWQEII